MRTKNPWLRLVRPGRSDIEEDRLEYERLEREQLARWEAEVEPPKPMPVLSVRVKPPKQRPGVLSFRVEPRRLSQEHARQVERFTGYPYNAEQEAKLDGWIAFKRWDHGQHLARARARLISTLHSVLQARQRKPGPGAA